MTPGQYAGAELTIDLGAIAGNYRRLRSRAPGAACAAVVKANAYGLGVDRVAPALADAGCGTFFVSSIDEGIELRAILDAEHGGDIYILTGLPDGAETDCAQYGLKPVLVALDQIDAWGRFCRDGNPGPGAAIKLDSGMTRLGLPDAELDVLANEPERLDGMTVDILISHLACAEESANPLNEEQRLAFDAARARLPVDKGSLANSSGIFLGPAYHYDLVRPGAALYGVNPTPDAPNPMLPVVALHGKILQLRDVDRDRPVGYGASHRMKNPGTLATVAVGYADGYLRSLGNRGAGYVGDIRVPVVGRVSMDMIVFDVTAVPADRLRVGESIELLGEGHGVDDIAAEAGTIGYEILTGLGQRYRRVYLDTGSATGSNTGPNTSPGAT